MGEIKVYDPPGPFAKLPALAARLGVKEATRDGSTYLVTKDGRSYDLFDLINALLDARDETMDKLLAIAQDRLPNAHGR